MKICFPVASDQGLASEVYGHFGSAPVFMVFNTETRTCEAVNNQDLGHTHGMCSPLKALDGKMVDAIVVGGIGAGAIVKLNALGIKVYRAMQGTVQDNIAMFEKSLPPEITVEHAYGGHAHGHSCGH